jgi:hypothetical protein
MDAKMAVVMACLVVVDEAFIELDFADCADFAGGDAALVAFGLQLRFGNVFEVPDLVRHCRVDEFGCGDIGWVSQVG